MQSMHSPPHAPDTRAQEDRTMIDDWKPPMKLLHKVSMKKLEDHQQRRRQQADAKQTQTACSLLMTTKFTKQIKTNKNYKKQGNNNKNKDKTKNR